MIIEQLTNAERQEIIEKNYQYNDKRPLTDETLEELGFEYMPIFPDFPENKEWQYLHDNIGLFSIIREHDNNGKLQIKGIMLEPQRVLFKTVGSVRMLIEALIGAKGYTVNIAELMEERDMLALENKYFAEHLLQNGYTKNEVDSIAKGFKDWKEKGEKMENKDKLVCSSCGESSDKEDFSMDEDYDYDVCDTCYQENYGK